MTLRVTVSIVPYGDEADERDVAVFNISNLGISEDGKQHKYGVEVNTYKTFNNGKPIFIFHNREDGFERLIELAMNAVIDDKDT